MFNAKLVIHALGTRGTEPCMFITLGIQVSCKLLIIRSWDDALLVQQCKDAGMLPIDQVQHVLVIGEGDELP